MNMLKSFFRRLFRKKTSSFSGLSNLGTDELLALMRHETHRIEKAVYNDILVSKKEAFQRKREKLALIFKILEDRGFPENEPTLLWSKKMYENFEILEKELKLAGSSQVPEFDASPAGHFLEFLSKRRSVRVWAEKQPKIEILEKFAYRMIDAARLAPNSGNRQTWRFVILKTPEEKKLLEKIKERHCITAPLLIFVGMDTRLYGALGESESCLYIDAGAAILNMILLAHKCGLGTCWNHLGDDIVASREINKEIFRRFTRELNIPDYIAPVALISIGIPEFLPPVPSRMNIESLMLDKKKKAR